MNIEFSGHFVREISKKENNFKIQDLKDITKNKRLLKIHKDLNNKNEWKIRKKIWI